MIVTLKHGLNVFLDEDIEELGDLGKKGRHYPLKAGANDIPEKLALNPFVLALTVQQRVLVPAGATARDRLASAQRAADEAAATLAKAQEEAEAEQGASDSKKTRERQQLLDDIDRADDIVLGNIVKNMKLKVDLSKIRDIRDRREAVKNALPQ